MPPHEQLQQKIPPYVARRLEASAAKELEAHLATCEECQELVTCCEEIAAEVREEVGTVDAAHPTPPRLREYALDGRADGRIAAHLDHCVTCALEVAVWKRNAPVVTIEPIRATASFPWVAWRSLVLGAALGAVITIGTFLLLEAPGSPNVRPAWSGAADSLVLREILRDSTSADAPSYRVPSGQPLIPLEVELTVPFDAEAGESYTFEVLTESGTATLVHETTVEAVRAKVRQTGTFGLFLAVESHPPGSYTLVIRNGGPESRRQTFKIER